MNELRYYEKLKRIAAYKSPEWLQRNSEKQYGLSYVEALEMAYDNIRGEAAQVIRGKRRPKPLAQNAGKVQP